MDVLLHDPVAVPEYLVLAFASSVMPAEALEKHLHGPGRMLDLLVGTGVICLYAACAYTYAVDLRVHVKALFTRRAFLTGVSGFFILSTPHRAAAPLQRGSDTSETPR